MNASLPYLLGVRALITEETKYSISCGKEMKIRAIVTDKAKIWRILAGIGWPTEAPEFDPPADFSKWEICQLVTPH